jgi:tripartite ATP-independent transporter DctM subunit
MVGRQFIEAMPGLILVGIIFGGVRSGIFTASESSCIAVVYALLVTLLAYRTLSWEAFSEATLGAVRTTAMIMLILMGAGFLSLAMGFTGIPRALATTIGAWELSPFALIAILTIFYIILGCFLDGLSSIVLTMAVIEPMVRAAGFDMLWFGVYVMIVVEMAQITPPIGFNLFVLQGMTGRDMGFISRASFPMFCVMGVFIVILYMFPELATWLPEVLSNRD